MKIKISSIFYNLLLLFTIILICLVIFNSKFRRLTTITLFNYSEFYIQKKINNSASISNYEKASKDLIKFINLSQKIYPGKNNIYKVILYEINNISKNQFDQEFFNIMEKVYLKIYEIDEKNYYNNVRLARALSDNDLEKSKTLLEQSLELSPSSEEAYKEILRIYLDLDKNFDLIDRYCKDYNNSFSIGATKKKSKYFFNGNKKMFGIYINDEKNKIYKNLLVKPGEKTTYKFYLDENKDLNKFTILGVFFPSSILRIEDIHFLDENKNLINLDRFYLTTENAYVKNDFEKNIKIIILEKKNILINFYLKEIKKDIREVYFNLTIDKFLLGNNEIYTN